MSVAAVMLVKDEADIIGHTLRHLAGHVDEIIVNDNLSTDGTRDVLHGDYGVSLIVHEDRNIAYYQSAKTTQLAMEAFDRGHQWVVPCDADEFWYAWDGRAIRDMLAGLAPDVQIVDAQLYNHIPTSMDKWDPNPFLRIGWRKREHGMLGKVACRLRPDLVIHAGNHDASTDGTAVRSGGLVVRHFSWRSAEQYVRKIRNGERAYAATSLPPDTGAHWRGWGDVPDDALAEHFKRWFWSAAPLEDDSLMYDPAPA